MKIAFKQVEIIAGLKLYIEAQGISLAGKTVEVEFTAGRKEAGLTADVEILSPELASALAAATITEGINANTNAGTTTTAEDTNSGSTVESEPEANAPEVNAVDQVVNNEPEVDPSTLGNKPSLFA